MVRADSGGRAARPARRLAVLLATSLLASLLAACAPSAAAPPSGAAPAPPASGAAAASSSSGAAPATQASGAAPTSAPAPIALRVAWSAPGGALTPIWVAYEQGLLREQGLDVELVFLSGTRTDQGVATLETPIGFGTNVIPTRLAGADLVAIAGVVNRISYTLFANPNSGISRPEDLRGKTMVTTTPGATNSSGVLVMLRHFGLVPNREVSLQPTQGTPEQLALMTQGLADAALFSPPTNLKAADLGLQPVANVTDLNIPFMQTAVGTNTGWARDHGEEIHRFLRGYVNAVALARRDAETTKALIGKYSQIDDPVALDEAYRYYRELWGRPGFRVPAEAVESILRVLDVPGADTADPNDFIDNHFVDDLDRSGFIRKAGAAD